MSSANTILLGVNVDHVATLRQARRADEPDPVAAGLLCERAGADGVTVHLREDRRQVAGPPGQPRKASVWVPSRARPQTCECLGISQREAGAIR